MIISGWVKKVEGCAGEIRGGPGGHLGRVGV